MIQQRFLVILIVLGMAIPTYAQTVGDRTKEKAETKTNNRIDNRVDEGLDKGLDAIEGLFKRKKKSNKKEVEEVPASESQRTIESSTQSEAEPEVEEQYNPMANSSFAGMFEAAEWKSSYSFDVQMIAHITETNKRGKVQESDLNMMLSDEAMAMIVAGESGKSEDATIVFDFTNHSFITLSESNGKKEGIAIAMNKDQLAAVVSDQVEEEYEGMSVLSTGKSKSILGYTCNEYKVESEESTGTMWVADDFSVDMQKVFGLMTGASKSKSTLPANYPDGYVMEMTSTDKGNGSILHYLVTDFNENLKETISTTEYNVMDPMQMMQQGGK